MNEQPKSKGGRPRAKVDPDLVEKLAGIGCPDREIAAIVGCSEDTLHRRFAEIIAKGRDNCKTRLRKKQIEVALSGNVSMLIWLGKNMLGQSDKIENKVNVAGQPGKERLATELEEFKARWDATKPRIDEPAD